MTTRYILFEGNMKQTVLATMIFEQVSCLNFNIRPIKQYTHKKGKVVSYPDHKKFVAFYRTAVERLQAEPEYDGRIPRVVEPVNPTRYE